MGFANYVLNHPPGFLIPDGFRDALAFLSQLEAGKALLPAAILIAGPQAFLKEYVLDACRDAVRGSGARTTILPYRRRRGFRSPAEAVSAPGLFAPATVALCRILRARGAADDDGEAGESRATRGPMTQSCCARSSWSERLRICCCFMNAKMRPPRCNARSRKLASGSTATSRSKAS